MKQALIFATILRAFDYNKIFHVHIDALTYEVGCILAQSGKKNMAFPICYANTQLNLGEKNYLTIDREGLRMAFGVKKYRHNLLIANKFVFFTDHQALLYLVNKPCNTGRIVRWFLILLKFDFTIVVK